MKAGFIYPIPLTKWVSNPIPFTKKQGTIRVCVNYRDLNQAFPKDNYPTPFIDQIIDDCVGCEVFSFMDGFSSYNQIEILLADQHKMTFICPWGTFACCKLPFGLKNVGASFQWAMSYAFHDIKHIVQSYLDNLPVRSKFRRDHLNNPLQVFVHCRYYNIQLNPHKCSFVVQSGRLLGFIVASDGIPIDPLKIEAIVNLPPPQTILQLQSLQGKEKILRRFIANYAKLTKGFMCLFKKGVPFVWDDQAQRSFDSLKRALTSTPMLQPPNYNRNFLLYLVASDFSIGMVLVQIDDAHIKHIIYYLSKGLVGAKLRYPHVEKLALATACVVQQFRHYILLRTTTVIFDTNPMCYILSRQILGGRYSKGTIILQEFDLLFSSPKAKKSMVFVELMFGLPRVSTDLVAESLLIWWP